MEITIEQLFKGKEEFREHHYLIYKHTSPSGKIYIGQTSFKNPIQRWRQGGKGYFRVNKYGQYQQPAIVNAIKKYNWDLWKHELIDFCDTREEANNLEEYYISFYKSNNKDYGYNITSGGDGHNGHSPSAETRKKISESVKKLWENEDYRKNQEIKHKGIIRSKEAVEKTRRANLGKKRTQETKDKLRQLKLRSIVQFNLQGDFVNEYECAKDAASILNCTITSITNSCKGITKKCKDYIFIYKDEYTAELLKNRIDNLNVNNRGRSIDQYTKDGVFINTYKSITQASKSLDISITNISNCLRGDNKSAGGFIFKYHYAD